MMTARVEIGQLVLWFSDGNVRRWVETCPPEPLRNVTLDAPDASNLSFLHWRQNSQPSIVDAHVASNQTRPLPSPGSCPVNSPGLCSLSPSSPSCTTSSCSRSYSKSPALPPSSPNFPSSPSAPSPSSPSSSFPCFLQRSHAFLWTSLDSIGFHGSHMIS